MEANNYKYYVYGYFSKKGLHAYVGKGQTDRVTQHIQENDSGKKVEWLRNNEYSFRLLGRFKTEEDATNAETMLIETCWKYPQICIPEGLLNIKRGHGGKHYFKKFDRLEDELNTGINIDLWELKKELRNTDRKIVVLNVRKSTKLDPYGDKDWIDYCSGYKNKPYKTMANEILVRCKGKIVAHYKDITWTSDGEGGHIPKGNKIMSSIFNGGVLTGTASKSQASVIHLYTYNYESNRLFNKRLKKENVKSEKQIR